MENLKIQPTFNTPTIDFDADTGKLFLKGRSIPEDPGEFYERIFHWLEEYFSKPGKETELEFQIEYANSGSTKYLLEILKEIYRLSSEGKNVKVIWCFEEDDESIEELGELFMNSVNLNFEMRVIEEEDEDEDE
jgi:hypothetical protein